MSGSTMAAPVTQTIPIESLISPRSPIGAMPALSCPPANPPASCVTPKGNPLLDNRLCTGNSQFTLQIWDSLQQNLHRYSINSNVDTVTLVMSWYGANKPVTFKQYDGSYDLASLPSTPNNQWTT